METVELDKIIHKELMIIDSESTSKTEVLEELITLLYENQFIDSKESFLADVYLREEEGVTGIGQGIAIPHGKSPSVLQTTVAIATMKNKIEWETLDDEPVEVVILFAVKDSDANTTHVLLLQQIAILLANDEFIDSLKKVTSIEELYDLVIK